MLRKMDCGLNLEGAREIDNIDLTPGESPDYEEVYNLRGKNNLADLFTKYVDQHTSDAHVRTMSYYFTSGRAVEAPQLHALSRPWATHIGTNVPIGSTTGIRRPSTRPRAAPTTP